MPTYNNLGSFNPQPTIIGPSEGDLEEARIKRLTDLAQLRNLQSQPGLEGRRLALQKAGLDQNAFAAFQQAQLEQRGQDVTERGQDLNFTTTVRGQNLGAQSEEANRAVTTRGQDQQFSAEQLRAHQALLATALSRPDIPLSEFRDAAETAGFGEFKKAFDVGHGHELDAKANQQIAALTALKSANDPASYLTALNAAKADPEVFGALKKNATPELLADIEATGKHVPPLATPVSPPNETPGYYPGVAPAIGRAVVNAPLGLANLGQNIYNRAFLPVENLARSVVGARPAKRNRPYSSYSDAFSR